ncbi:MAG: hypothetical protein D6741_16920, partial [Planctomycetota bacterium]
MFSTQAAARRFTKFAELRRRAAASSKPHCPDRLGNVMPKFEISCPTCGAKHLVDLKQAGTSLSCTCGRSVDVPSRSKLLDSDAIIVDQDDVGGDHETKPVSIRYLLLAGAAVLLLLAAIGGVYVWATWPTPEPMSHMYPLDAFNYWVHVRQGIDADLFVIEKRWADALALY